MKIGCERLAKFKKLKLFLEICLEKIEARRERLNSALYLRLKKRELFKICSGRLWKTKKFRITFEKPKRSNWRAKKGTIWHFLTFFLLQNIKKNEGESFGDIENEISEQSHSAKKCKRGNRWGFFNIHSVAKYQKNEGGPFGVIKIFLKIVKGGSLACFRGSGRRFCFRRGSDVSSMFWTSVFKLNK